jgi:hypothetical protein
MMQTFIGRKYIYKIDQHKLGENFSLALKAVDKKTRRVSTINTINPLLSELKIDSNNNQFWESEWFVTKNEFKILLAKIKKILSDKEYLKYFESYLDKDRIEGEWENFETQ